MEPNRLLNLFAGIAVARREGVQDSRVAQVAIPALFFPNLALAVILVDRLAKQEAAAEAAASLPATGTTTGSTGSTTGSGTTTGSTGTTTGSTGGVSVIGGSTGPTGTTPLPLPIAYPSVSLQPV